MKKIILALLAAILTTSCSDLFNFGKSKSADQIAQELVSSINIEGATMLFEAKQLVGTKSGDIIDEGDGYYKIDEQGQISKILFIDKDGEYNDIDIDYIVKINSDVLYLKLNYEQMQSMTQEQSGDADTQLSEYATCYILNVKNGEMFHCVNDAHLNVEMAESIDDDYNLTVHNCGKYIYFYFDKGRYMYKFDIENMSLSSAYMDNFIGIGGIIDKSNVFITKDGEYSFYVVSSSTNHLYSDGNVIVCVPASALSSQEERIVLQENVVSFFGIDNDIYTYTSTMMYKWSNYDGEFRREEIALPEGFRIGYTRYNYVKNSVMLSSLDLRNDVGEDSNVISYYEFDGSQFTKLDLGDDFNGYGSDKPFAFWWYDTTVIKSTSTMWWWYSINYCKYMVVSMEDYSLHTVSFDKMAYCVNQNYSDHNVAGIVALGYRYSDAKNFIAELGDDLELQIREFTTSAAVTQLVPIN